jgi:hypothetical protein
VISSDRVRKGLPPFSDAPDPRRSEAWGEGGYSEAAKDGVYDALFGRAGAVLESGRVPILDASFSQRRWRDAAARWCRDRGVRAVLVETICAAEVGSERLTARARAGRDPSDAGPELLGASISSYEPPDEWPATARLRVRSDAPDWARQLERVAPRLREPDLRTPR